MQQLLEKIYKRRFGCDIEFRRKMWKVVCSNFFQRYVPAESVVLDVGAGYCDFINNIKARKKIALDLNPDIKKFAERDVAVIQCSSTRMKKIAAKSIDVAFTSNFFEHLKKEDIVKTIREVHKVLKKNGKFLILQPNIRYCFKDYWMFFDHVTPLDDRSLSEALEINGFKIEECKPKFLPYTLKSNLRNLPAGPILLRIYLALPIAQKIFGKQAFICAKKT